jgi:hypothetical protein
MLNAVPPHIECLHVDFDCSGQCRDEAKLPGGPPVVVETDASGADDCGSIFAAEDPPALSDRAERLRSRPAREPVDHGVGVRDLRRPRHRLRWLPRDPDPVHSARGRGLPGGRARACDDGSGRFADGCEIVGRATVPGRLCELAASRLSCRLDEDPLGCVVDQISAGDLVRECPVSVNCGAPTRGDRGAAGPGHRYVHLDRGRRERARRLDRRVRQARLVLH